MIPSGIIIYEFIIYELEYQLETNSLGRLHLKTNAMIPVYLFSLQVSQLY